MLKKVLAATMCLAMAAGMTACGGSGDSGSGSSDSGEKELTILTADDTTEGGALKAMAEKYQEETGIKVTMTEVPYGDMETKLLNMIKAGNAPAVVRYSSFAAYSDYLLDISDIAPSQDEMFLATEIDGKTPGAGSQRYSKWYGLQQNVVRPGRDHSSYQRRGSVDLG